MKNLKMVSSVVLVALSFVFICSLAFAEEVHWNKEFDGRRANQYTLKIANASCAINVFEDGTLEVHAHDYDWGGYQVSQVMVISPDKIHKEIVYATRDGFITPAVGYSVFYVKFREYVKGLPPEVRAKFYGGFGIE